MIELIIFIFSCIHIFWLKGRADHRFFPIIFRFTVFWIGSTFYVKRVRIWRSLVDLKLSWKSFCSAVLAKLAQIFYRHGSEWNKNTKLPFLFRTESCTFFDYRGRFGLEDFLEIFLSYWKPIVGLLSHENREGK